MPDGGVGYEDVRSLDSLCWEECGERIAEGFQQLFAFRDRRCSMINDFAFKIGTVKGTGSASANGLIMQAIFRMGIPVSGKNVFPSNIQGLPTWYEIRVSERGYTARTPQFDPMVALNPATYGKDVAEVRSGGWLRYASTR